MFLRQTAKSGDIVIARKIKFAFFRLVNIPKNIEAQRIHTQRLAHPNAVFPIFLWNTRVMDFRRFDNEGLSIQQKRVFADFKSFLFCLPTTGKYYGENCQTENDTVFFHFLLYFIKNVFLWKFN
jgi:hypothetical protein